MVKLAWPLALAISGGDGGRARCARLGRRPPAGIECDSGSTLVELYIEAKGGGGGEASARMQVGLFHRAPIRRAVGSLHRSDPQRAMLVALSRLVRISARNGLVGCEARGTFSGFTSVEGP